MNKSFFHRVYSLVLIIALAFGQVGAGFFHNKHDAHEAVVDLDHTVLVAHGEHCKICSVDWLHQFLVPGFDISSVQEEHIVAESNFRYSIIDPSRLLTKDRAPPAFS